MDKNTAISLDIWISDWLFHGKSSILVSQTMSKRKSYISDIASTSDIYFCYRLLTTTKHGVARIYWVLLYTKIHKWIWNYPKCFQSVKKVHLYGRRLIWILCLIQVESRISRRLAGLKICCENSLRSCDKNNATNVVSFMLVLRHGALYFVYNFFSDMLS